MALLGIVLLFDSYFLFNILNMSFHCLSAYKISIEKSTCTVVPPYLWDIHFRHCSVTAGGTEHWIYSTFSYTDTRSHVQKGTRDKGESCLRAEPDTRSCLVFLREVCSLKRKHSLFLEFFI